MARFLSPWKNLTNVVMFIVTRSLEVFEIGLSARKYRNCIYFWIFWLIKCDKFKSRGEQCERQLSSLCSYAIYCPKVLTESL